MKLNRRQFIGGLVASATVASIPKFLFDNGWVCCADEFPPDGLIADIKFYHPESWGTGGVDIYKALKTVHVNETLQFGQPLIFLRPGGCFTCMGWLEPGRGLLVLQPDRAFWRPARAPKLVLSKATKASYISKDGYINFV